ncbi:ribosomal protein L14p/L23e family protein [Actinidia rufa]|uniref:Ribosomal protein L14p/L23e family protein n=1 Tax=Actinidia rufa TaxID=165716 RepID=A0A7J0GJY5_9ERIC|nr:ribosomal protein L14p/L23e family protein [Actinidia rufa]
MCIQALKGEKGARLGDTLVASVKESQPGGKVKKGDVVYAVVVRAAMPRGRCDGSEVKFDDNAAVLVNKQGEPIGTRVFGPVPHELRKKKHLHYKRSESLPSRSCRCRLAFTLAGRIERQTTTITTTHRSRLTGRGRRLPDLGSFGLGVVGFPILDIDFSCYAYINVERSWAADKDG